MRIDKLDLEPAAVKFLESAGYTELYPPQAQSIKAGLLKGKSVLVSAPTASGKTLIAMMAILSRLGEGKIIYLSPLRALAAEKYAEFQKLGRACRIKVGISTGESGSSRLEESDVMVLTNERMDLLLRRDPAWLENIVLVITDEVHLIGDSERGPTLEMVITRLARLAKRPQLVGLSATITNADEISKWMGAVLVHSDWRPVPLTEGVCDGQSLMMRGESPREIQCTQAGPAIDLAAESVRDGAQALVFAETRVRSASLASKGAPAVLRTLTRPQKARLEKAAARIIASGEQTRAVRMLAELVRKGTAFHHAGLSQACRHIVEEEFRGGAIKLLSSTPTLAAGVNLPARRVVISSITRYNVQKGASMPISILEYKQLCGRAGRPQYDEYGEAIIVSKHDPYEIADHYIDGIPEPIESRITDDRAMRIHVLSLLASSPGLKKEAISGFFADTFGGSQSSSGSIKFGIKVALQFLKTKGFVVEKAGSLQATAFGRQASMLYIDPMTASHIRDALESAGADRTHTLGFLHLVCTCDEFYPKMSMRQADYEQAGVLLEGRASELLWPVTEYDCSRSLLALNLWMQEAGEAELAENLRVESGDMHRMIETGGWLLRCAQQIAHQDKRKDLADELGILRVRVAYGIRKELVDLVQIKGIGRVRARALYKRGIKSPDDLASLKPSKLASIDKIGPRVAAQIRAQLKLH